jgi:hypothetical protein
MKRLPPRPAPKCCRHEPVYPAHATVLFAIAAPDLTCHAASASCLQQGPHPITDCLLWSPR